MSDDETDVTDLVPAAPQDLATLRSLLFSLSPPPSPDILSARTGIISPTSGGSGVDGNLSLQSSADPNGAGYGQGGGMGGGPSYYGETNLLDDPTFESLYGTGITPSAFPVQTVLSPEWKAYYVLNSGTLPGTLTVEAIVSRTDGIENQSGSAVVRILVTDQFLPYDIDVYIAARPVEFGGDILGAAYLTAAIRYALNVTLMGGT